MPKTKIISSLLETYWNEFLEQKISPQDITGLFILTYFRLFQEENFFQISGVKRHISLEGKTPKSYLIEQDQHLLSLLKTSRFKDLYSFFSSVNLKKTKGIVLKSLCLWYQGEFKLEVYDHIPSPLEVLHLQTLGKRCISLLRTPEELSRTYDHGRNVQEFLFHDLEHAWQMFSDPTLTPLQIEMSKKLLALNQKGVFEEILAIPDLKKELDYIFSDMNTHPSHTLMSLKSIILKFYKKDNPSSRLNEPNEKAFQSHWNFLAKELI